MVPVAGIAICELRPADVVTFVLQLDSELGAGRKGALAGQSMKLQPIPGGAVETVGLGEVFDGAANHGTKLLPVLRKIGVETHDILLPIGLDGLRRIGVQL